MRGSSSKTVVIVLLLGLIIIVISPVVDLEPTTLRSVHALNMMFALLALAGRALLSLFSGSRNSVDTTSGLAQFQAPSPDLIDLNCSRLC